MIWSARFQKSSNLSHSSKVRSTMFLANICLDYFWKSPLVDMLQLSYAIHFIISPPLSLERFFWCPSWIFLASVVVKGKRYVAKACDKIHVDSCLVPWWYSKIICQMTHSSSFLKNQDKVDQYIISCLFPLSLKMNHCIFPTPTFWYIPKPSQPVKIIASPNIASAISLKSCNEQITLNKFEGNLTLIWPVLTFCH